MEVRKRWNNGEREARFSGVSRREVKKAAADAGARYEGKHLQPTVFGTTDQITQVVRALGDDTFVDVPQWHAEDGGGWRSGNAPYGYY